ncbi:23S rRNA (cytidine1920-2'-O)/16S rRNA (cytidine1409-2'-O)-methyltransferase [Thermosulfidibacter takaii ABI70S6]|uniref:23S rRNA (Cytidine1920-2'-O)/16S rRNA (Cytidine1409-2'-O)-methyltransferase n=1 Tax=Thermosulfidibacter takaii (strain DSM 17441 / JCM 13301 / NBRC 103674 / ABI70S6) TaxID=1298851 RepID=A0A0S3QVJ8_THET7|nr:TlyA family RNA methyltransferase [Thermosulfidibacter takaii]BAT72351.1 23S rRNA (cytidine1920-2'-O)/16S rRNA (cytidine1409-2'-O)-methyltransferase [Thermosulfidibacter takaii ABI70S6]
MAKKSLRERLDKLLVDKGFVESREKAKALIMAGKVLVNGEKVTKAGTKVACDAAIELVEDLLYVSRGGIKLEAALREFGIDVTDKICVDIGASTGGFTDCLLQHGAKRVYAIDVGYGQLHWKLRNDPRVINIEKTNIRYIPRNIIPENVDFVCVDVSFISLEKVLPKVKEILGNKGEAVCLVKPQFEVGPEKVGKGGVVREERYRKEALEKVSKVAIGLGFTVKGVIPSPIKGSKGNQEYLMYMIL